MSKYPGLISFVPVDDPGLPFPYADGSPEQKDAYERTEYGKSQYWENFQKTNNHTAIAAGNKKAADTVNHYNTQIKNYVDNGGAAKGYKLPPPPEQLNLEQYYPPAVDATVYYVPPSASKPGYWADLPGVTTETEVWTLPEGTILWVRQAQPTPTPQPVP